MPRLSPRATTLATQHIPHAFLVALPARILAAISAQEISSFVVFVVAQPVLPARPLRILPSHLNPTLPENLPPAHPHLHLPQRLPVPVIRNGNAAPPPSSVGAMQENMKSVNVEGNAKQNPIHAGKRQDRAACSMAMPVVPSMGLSTTVQCRNFIARAIAKEVSSVSVLRPALPNPPAHHAPALLNPPNLLLLAPPPLTPLTLLIPPSPVASPMSIVLLLPSHPVPPAISNPTAPAP